jgi:hypothetical protein
LTTDQFRKSLLGLFAYLLLSNVWTCGCSVADDGGEEFEEAAGGVVAGLGDDDRRPRRADRSDRISLAAGVLYPAFGLLLSTIVAAAAVALVPVSVVDTRVLPGPPGTGSRP